jgi:hypothetical protein
LALASFRLQSPFIRFADAGFTQYDVRLPKIIDKYVEDENSEICCIIGQIARELPDQLVEDVESSVEDSTLRKKLKKRVEIKSSKSPSLLLPSFRINLQDLVQTF